LLAAQGLTESVRVGFEGVDAAGIFPGLTVFFGHGQAQGFGLFGEHGEVAIEGVPVIPDLGELTHGHATGEPNEGKQKDKRKETLNHAGKVA